MNLVTWDPYRELGDLPSQLQPRLQARSRRRERDEELSLGSVDSARGHHAKRRTGSILTAELPGFQESDVEVQMEGGILTLRGERKSGGREGGTHASTGWSAPTASSSAPSRLPNNVDRETHQGRPSPTGCSRSSCLQARGGQARQIKIGVGDGNGHKRESIGRQGPVTPECLISIRRARSGGAFLCLLRRARQGGSWARRRHCPGHGRMRLKVRFFCP